MPGRSNNHFPGTLDGWKVCANKVEFPPEAPDPRIADRTSSPTSYRDW